MKPPVFVGDAVVIVHEALLRMKHFSDIYFATLFVEKQCCGSPPLEGLKTFLNMNYKL